MSRTRSRPIPGPGVAFHAKPVLALSGPDQDLVSKVASAADGQEWSKEQGQALDACPDRVGRRVATAARVLVDVAESDSGGFEGVGGFGPKFGAGSDGRIAARAHAAVLQSVGQRSWSGSARDRGRRSHGASRTGRCTHRSCAPLVPPRCTPSSACSHPPVPTRFGLRVGRCRAHGPALGRRSRPTITAARQRRPVVPVSLPVLLAKSIYARLATYNP